MASVRERVSKHGERTWQALYRHGNKQTSLTFASREKADEFAALVDILGPDRALKIHRGEVADDRLTIAELAEKFLTWKARPGEVTQRTMADYRRDYANWIEPTFGHRVAESVDEADVQKWVDQMATRLAPKSVADRHMLLHSMFKYGKARSRRLVSHNPCEETEMPKVRKKRAKGTTLAQWRAILNAAAERDPDAHDLILFLGAVGWRFSEAIALPVENVEQRHDGAVMVEMTQVFRIVDNRQVLTPDAAKSFAGFRRVEVLSEEAAAMLLRRVVGKGPGDLVFTNRRGKHWNQGTFLRETWPRLLEAAGLWNGPRKSPTPHWLRHMAVGWLLGSGVTIEEVRRYVGHDDVKVTLGTYGGRAGGVSADARANARQMLSGEGPAGMVVVGEVVENELG